MNKLIACCILLCTVSCLSWSEFADYVYLPPAPKALKEKALPDSTVQRWLHRPCPELLYGDYAEKAWVLKEDTEGKFPLRVAAGIPTEIVADQVFGEGVLEDGQWTYVGRVGSLNATALRLRLVVADFPADAVLWMIGDASETLYGPFTAATLPDGDRYLPTTFGESVVLVYQSAAHAPTGFTLTGVSHHFQDLAEKAAKSLPCPTPVACEADIPFQEVSTGVGMMLIPDGIGNQYLCTGALINRPDTETLEPYLITAHHCVDHPFDPDWVEVLWDFRAPDCSGEDPPSQFTVPRSYGHALLVTNKALDAAFMELDSVPVNDYGRAWLGWDSTPPEMGDIVACAHHAAGTPMKLAHGTILNPDTTGCLDLLCNKAVCHQIKTNWMLGITQGGSSGAPLLHEATNYRIIGMLSNGPVHNCNFPAGNVDNFASFAWFFPEIQCYITNFSPCAPPLISKCGRVCPIEYLFGRDSATTNQFRAFRDDVLAPAPFGTTIINAYYTAAPGVTRWLRSTAATD